MSRRKDRERFLQHKQRNPNYAGFRGNRSVIASPPENLTSVTCSVCRRKRNVPSDTVPADRDSFVCLQCQESPAPAPAADAQ